MAVTRRTLLKHSLAAAPLAALAPTLPGLLARTAAAAAQAEGDRVLVVVQLTGGNDGLNTVVPYEDDRYAKARPTLRLDKRQVLPLADSLGWHPRLGAFAELFKEGRLTVVQGVGYPNPNRSHGAAMRIWQAAEVAEARIRTGWLGRAADRVYRPAAGNVPAVYVGALGSPLALAGDTVAAPAVRRPEQCRLRPANLARWLADQAARPADDELLAFVRRGTAAAVATNQKVAAVLDRGGGDYPAGGLAERLRSIAQLIDADLGVRIFYTELGGGDPGGFDNHANQADNHGVLLAELADAVKAFVADIDARGHGRRVVLMTFSEFGRSLEENGRNGTDHGSAAPLFVAGAVKGGLVGRHPSLADLEGNAPRAHTDFRQVYATMLTKWLGLDAAAILGGRYAPLELV